MFGSYKSKKWIYIPNIPTTIWRFPCVLYFSILANTSFLEFTGRVSPAATSIHANLHPSWKHLRFLSFSVSRWCFRTSSNVLNYARIFFAVRLYSNTSLNIIFDAKYFIPRSLTNASHSIYRFVIISKNVGAAFRGPVVITFRHQFMSRVKKASVSCAYSYTATYKYPFSIYTAIKKQSCVSNSFNASWQQGLWKANMRVTCFSFWW